MRLRRMKKQNALTCTAHNIENLLGASIQDANPDVPGLDGSNL
jgi:hypothetical protein